MQEISPMLLTRYRWMGRGGGGKKIMQFLCHCELSGWRIGWIFFYFLFFQTRCGLARVGERARSWSRRTRHADENRRSDAHKDVIRARRTRCKHAEFIITIRSCKRYVSMSDCAEFFFAVFILLFFFCINCNSSVVRAIAGSSVNINLPRIFRTLYGAAERGVI